MCQVTLEYRYNICHLRCMLYICSDVRVMRARSCANAFNFLKMLPSPHATLTYITKFSLNALPRMISFVNAFLTLLLCKQCELVMVPFTSHGLKTPHSLASWVGGRPAQAQKHCVRIKPLCPHGEMSWLMIAQTICFEPCSSGRPFDGPPRS